MNHVTASAAHKAEPLIEIKSSDIEKTTKRTWKRQFLAVVVLLLVAILSVPAMAAWAGNLWIDQSKLDHVEQLATGAYVKLDDMPDYVWKSFVSIEDHRFWKHHGVDFFAFGRAVWTDIQAGSYAQGASTISMQLARNLFLTQDKTVLRKAKEIAIAYQLEQRYSKKELLEMYLNVIYFGHGRYGIGAAAPLYFGKTSSNLTLGEAAILASLPKAPETYSPLNHLQKAKQRQAVVLARMVELGVITKTQKLQAQMETAPIAPAS
ncbi:transglycosylase domain-containing protein [Brevibacillus choshinensis]|uniref:Transglycosylase domain-containing protein n=1 Tax=Brevibacillus choshinensis TaxID=54911 RepID=A0ABX7FW45_BRECH|nr:transglycosylase domain-containing protein [Brevibacillus choshinensis]QRG70019.1 transglycosylase domain-containing protein [Brevibacillus choshinensis]